ncbi:Swi5-dependent recombination DNA repair protein 1 -like protein [Trichinella pseudospiralis]|uniref:Swi5-dependent recombination DNA repair protein 1 homolog n=1 Tax=Trichinella pseudospiralis TaxID=6337 RepID=A0A0V1IHL4_TRIPS|nr:Swi5-dependent recombination DNA repair protein 1 -like protein [Trichinella pseudospiralis]KRY67088.1 Swi5-dependent recombination DNA repair protein 1 -like protein [Trichinella pseudospiralis]KRZ22230.1 Swi5-dependent recombination DNA repair protein 1 -like protein [Trichinella pseudospiralis]KRZ24143.1 Swi5-dependent recombination DNA repair protein 1 -like protein [Trichinella pseudospiralis]
MKINCPTFVQAEMSNFSPALRKRLKMQGRCFKSNPKVPLSNTAKHISEIGNIAESVHVDLDGTTAKNRKIETARNNLHNEDTNSIVPIDNNMQIQSKLRENQGEENLIGERIKKKNEKLRRLRLVEHYRSTKDFVELDKLTKKWLAASQNAAQSLWDALPTPKPSMADFLKSMNINLNLIQYNETEDQFY